VLRLGRLTRWGLSEMLDLEYAEARLFLEEATALEEEISK
jgi:hypothetical protein